MSYYLRLDGSDGTVVAAVAAADADVDVVLGIGRLAGGVGTVGVRVGVLGQGDGRGG